MTQNPPALSGVSAIADDRAARRLKALEKVFGDKFVKTFASPYIVLEDQVIESPPAIRFYKKDFEYLSKQLYVEYQYRSWKGYNQELLDRYAELVSTKLSNIKILMSNWVARLEKLLEQNGKKGEDLSLWPTVHNCDVPVIATHARTYLDVLKMLDRIHVLAGSCNLWGVIDSQVRAEAELQCKKAVRAFRSVLQNEVVKLYREGERIIREQHGGGQANPQMAAIVEQQGQDIADMQRTAEEDDALDGGLGLKDADASQVIDDAAAASTAQTAAAKPKRTGRAKSDAPAPAANGGDQPGAQAEPATPAAAA